MQVELPISKGKKTITKVCYEDKRKAFLRWI